MVNYILVAQLLFEQNGKCPICKRNLIGEPMQVHHIDKNRDNKSIENLLAVHPECHYAFHGKDEKIESTIISPVISTDICPKCERIKQQARLFYDNTLMRLQKMEENEHFNVELMRSQRVNDIVDLLHLIYRLYPETFPEFKRLQNSNTPTRPRAELKKGEVAGRCLQYKLTHVRSVRILQTYKNNIVKNRVNSLLQLRGFPF